MSICLENSCGARTGWFRVKLALCSVPVICPSCRHAVQIAPFAQWLGISLYSAVFVASLLLAQLFAPWQPYFFAGSLLLGICSVQLLLWRFAPIDKLASRAILWRYRMQAIVAFALMLYAGWLVYQLLVR